MYVWSLWSGGGVLVVAVLAVLRMQMQQQRRVAALGDRVAHLTAGMSLLTDTIEGGLRDVAQEVERIAGPRPTTKPKARAATQRRVSGAARRGRSVQTIAAEEKMSEGEVRLRLQLTGAGRETAHAAVR